jgi:hypothetical protein
VLNQINNIEAAEMAERAASEIEQLRKENERLAPKAHAYDQLSIVLGLLPQQSQGFGVDLAWQLRRRAEELRTPPSEDSEA